MTDCSLLTLLEESYEPTTVSPPRRRPIHPKFIQDHIGQPFLIEISFPSCMHVVRIAFQPALSFVYSVKPQRPSTKSIMNEPPNRRHNETTSTTTTARGAQIYLDTRPPNESASINKSHSLSRLFLESLRNRCGEYLED